MGIEDASVIVLNKAVDVRDLVKGNKLYRTWVKYQSTAVPFTMRTSLQREKMGQVAQYRVPMANP